MDTVTYVDIEQINGTIKTFAIIDRGNGEFTSMLKADYDAQQASLNDTPQG